MNTLALQVGQTASRSNTLTAEHVRLYAEITGDRNPLHFDTAFAARTPFARLVVHGGLITGILNALVAEDMPGPGTVFTGMNLRFIRPVYVGDTITATAEVLEVHPSKPSCRLAVRIARDNGEIVLTGETWCYQFSA